MKAKNQHDSTKISKFLSLVLRHQPEAIGITLDPQGWTEVAPLIKAMRQKSFDIDLDLLKTVVATNAKQRFALSEDFTQIRANQGHSISVDLAYEVQSPPEILYHGTAQQHVAAIWREGIHKGQRHHVHLSPDPATAHNVGQRHGKPYVFVVLAQEMHAAGHLFYCSQNGVWLTEHVPTQFLREG